MAERHGPFLVTDNPYLKYVPLVGRLLPDRKAYALGEKTEHLIENTVAYFLLGVWTVAVPEFTGVWFSWFFFINMIVFAGSAIAEYGLVMLFGDSLKNRFGWKAVADLPTGESLKVFWLAVYQAFCYFMLGLWVAAALL